MILLLDGQQVDVFDDVALMNAIRERTERVLQPGQVAGTAEERERVMVAFVTYAAVKVGALATYHRATGEAVSIEHVEELAEQLHRAVGLQFKSEAQPAQPEIIVPLNAAKEGEDADESEEA